MPRTFRLLSIRHTTTIILVDSNFNMIQGDLRYIDRSTTITNRDAFNIDLESTVTEQPLPSTTSSVPTPQVSPNPSAARHEHDIDGTSSTSELISNLQGSRGSRPMEMTASVHSTTTKTSHFDVDERRPRCITVLIKKNRFRSICKKIKNWIKRAS